MLFSTAVKREAEKKPVITLLFVSEIKINQG